MTRRIDRRVAAAVMTVLALTACGSGTTELTSTGTARSTQPTIADTTASTAPAATTAATLPPTDPAPPPTTEPTEPRTITVGGRGTDYGPPDRGTVEVGVAARRATVAEATAQASAAGAAMIDALEAVGVPASDIQTTQFSIQPWYDSVNYTQINGYETTIGYRVTLTDVTALGSILASATEAGGDSVRAWSVGFEGDPADHIEPARTAAWIDVRARAEATAREIGEPLGHLLDVHEKVLVTTPSGMMQGGEGDSASFEVPVSPGVVGVIVLLTVTYEIGG